MDLKVVLLRKLPRLFVDVVSVSMTADLNLLSVLTKDKSIEIYNISSSTCRLLKVYDVLVYSWQEDVSKNGVYNILCISADGNIVCRSINCNSTISLSSLIKWNIETIFQGFSSAVKDVKEFRATEILKYETQGAVISFNDRFIVTFLLSSNEPRIISFVDVCEVDCAVRKMLLVKETTFILNHSGTVISAYSVSSNSKVLELDLTRSKFGSDEIGAVIDFVVSLERDIIILQTEFSQLYYMVIGDSWDSTTSSNYNCSPLISTVTAFTKQFPSIQPVGESIRRHSYSALSGMLRPIVATEETRDMNLQHMALYNGKLCLLFSCKNNTNVYIHYLGSEKVSCMKRSLETGYIVTGNSETFPLLLCHEDKLSLLLHDIECDKLVNELMLYQCGHIAESLSRLNHWQNICIDIEVLKQGLRNRQLDAINFFLKTHRERFQQLLLQMHEDNFLELSSECSSWTEIMDQLLSAINISKSDSQAHSFVKELLKIATSAAIHLLTDLQQGNGRIENIEVNDVKTSALAHISNCLCLLRQLIYEATDDDDDSGSDMSGGVGSYQEHINSQWQKWDRMTWKDVLEESLTKGSIALAQGYFLNHRDTSKRQYGNIESFHNYGLQLVVSYLKQRSISEAVVVLSNLGISVNEKLHDILKNTCENDTRATLMKELISRNLLTEEDESLLHFASVIENLYPCTSFQLAKQLQEEKWIDLEDWYRCAYREKTTPPLTVGDLVEPSGNNCETSAYCRIILQWLLPWDSAVRERILVPQLLKGSSTFNINVSPMSVWLYILENGDSSLILKWISSWAESSQPSNEFPYNWPVTAEMINCIKTIAPLHVAEITLNELARYGIFNDEEQEEMFSLLYRIGTSDCDFNDPETFSSEESTLSFDDLCHRLVHFSLDHNLISFLVRFMMRHFNNFKVWPSCDFCYVPFIKSLKDFCIWSASVNDPCLAFKAIVSTGEFLHCSTDKTLKALLLNVPSPLNIAMLLFNSKPLQVLIKEQQFGSTDLSHLKKSLISFPFLYDSLIQNKEAENLKEISVYQLLQSNSPFDVTKLFGWQSTNVLKGDESLSEMPHFLMDKLCDRYGLKETLTHFYYLLEGRPNFAFLKFLAQEIISGNQISFSRIRLCCKHVLRFALSNFKDEKICSACVTFLEMLGQDSLPLRTCLVNANTLYEEQYNKCEFEDSKDKIYQEISSLFQNALDDKDAASKIICFLEAEILQKIHISDTKNAIFDDIMQWAPVVTLANFYDVAVGEAYLCLCAKQDDWLRLLVFSQIFQITKETVLKVLPQFNNACIGNHLSKALINKKLLLSELPFQATRVPIQKKRDLRKSLYSRIGLIKHDPVHKEAVVNESDDETTSLCSIDTTASSEPETGTVIIMKDLFLQLLHAHGTDIPWMTLLLNSLALHNPILSVLAASYQDAENLCCFTIWMMTALPKLKTSKGPSSEKAFNILTSWTEKDLEKTIIQAVQKRKFLLLQQGFSIFLPNSPLCTLMDYLLSFFVYKKFEDSKAILREFGNKLAKHKDKESTQETLDWIERISIVIIKEAIIVIRINYERQDFLHQLASEKLFRNKGVPDFGKLYSMVLQLDAVGGIDNIESFMKPATDQTYIATCWKSVHKLLESHHYSEAQRFALISPLPLHEVLLLQIKYESDKMQKMEEWAGLACRILFWKRIISLLKQSNLNLQQIVEFFQDKCESTDRYGEKCFLMQVILSYKNKNIDLCEISTLTRNMWFWFIKEVQSEQLTPEEFDALLPSSNIGVFDESFHIDIHLDEEASNALEKIIYRLLEKKNMNQAFAVAQIFHHDCHDLKIIKTCLSLARAESDPDTVDVTVEPWNQTTSPSRKKSIVAWTNIDPNSRQMMVINIMQKLCERTEVSALICEQILVQYSIAAVLNCSFNEIAMESDPFTTLKSILRSKCKEKFALARTFIIVFELRDENVANFLSSEIHLSIQMVSEKPVLLPEDTSAEVDDEDLIYNPAFVDKGFQLTTKLCQDPSLLGRRLMSTVYTLLTDFEIAANSKSLYVMVELSICAHNCFTAACNVDGISLVLQKARKIVMLLTEAGQFSFMVNLLTGIGRYSEMKYVFDQLHEHNQIENQLLKKKMRKVPHLKLALLDYLKRCPSSDNYYSALVNSFNMKREIAQDREIAARKNLARFCKETADPDLKKKLVDVMKDLVAASEIYCQADCLLQAQLCAELVNLIALQVHLFDTGAWVIGLDDITVSRYIRECKQFSEALIIAEAYKNHQCWSQAIAYNVIQNGDRNYFKEFQSHMGISESLIEDVARSYNILPNKSETQLRNMKWILSYCHNIELKYELAKQLGFNDVVQDLNMGENSAYLQDLLAQSSKAFK